MRLSISSVTQFIGSPREETSSLWLYNVGSHEAGSLTCVVTVTTSVIFDNWAGVRVFKNAFSVRSLTLARGAGKGSEMRQAGSW